MSMLYIDAYKLDHRRQYPKKTVTVYSNFTARGSRIPGQDHVVFVGLQYFLQKYMADKMYENFFSRNRVEAVEYFKNAVATYVGPNDMGTAHIERLWQLGYMPLEFKALPEGTRVPLRVPMLTVENTIDEFYWLPNYIETLLSCTIWGPITSATNAGRLRKFLDESADFTGSNKDFVQWQGHDFSFRGMFGLEAAKLSGMGHLVFFTGTDTLPAIEFVNKYYGPNTGLIGGSVYATEHAVMCAHGKESEDKTIDYLLDLYPTGIVSIVSDTWDLWKLITEYLPARKERIMSRNGKVVIRPDTGVPVHILCGDPNAEKGTPQYKGVIQLLWEIFGGTINSKGFKVLDSHIGTIYGDAIDYEMAQKIMLRLGAMGFASENVVLGVGSFTYQYVTRDTYGQAMKATYAVVDGQGRDLWKDPATDPTRLKRSAKGRLAVVEREGKLTLVEQASRDYDSVSKLETVWKNGTFVKRTNFDTIRKIANQK